MRPDGRPSGPAHSDRQGDRHRVFFALWPDATVAGALHRLATDCARRFAGRAMRRDTLHLTLAFIGEVETARLEALRAAAGRVRGEACELCLDRLGFWSHNRILWAGSAEPVPPLERLAADLARELAAEGFSTDGSGWRPFAPHLTLLRNVAERQPELPALAPLSWAAREFVLVRSRLSSGGASYETIGRWPLLQKT